MLPLALDTSLSIPALHILRFLRKEVIQPQVLLRLPCYDFTPVICPALDGSFPKVRPPALGIADSHGVTGGVYKARERIHRGMLTAGARRASRLSLAPCR